jgi:hypothetical protein
VDAVNSRLEFILSALQMSTFGVAESRGEDALSESLQALLADASESMTVERSHT